MRDDYKRHEIKGVNYNYKNRNISDHVGDLLFASPLLPQELDKQLQISRKINENPFFVGNLEKRNKNNFDETDRKRDEIKDYGTLRKKFVNFIHLNIHDQSKDGNIIQKATQIRTWEQLKFELAMKIKDKEEREKFKRAVERRVLAKFDEVYLENYLFILY